MKNYPDSGTMYQTLYEENGDTTRNKNGIPAFVDHAFQIGERNN
jgi:hypothetical protein